jgi:hypothetical protein
MPTTYELIQTYTLPSSQTSYTFSNIPQTFTDLVMVASIKTSAQGGYIGFEVRFNGATSSYNDFGFQWTSSGTPSVYHETNVGSMNVAGSTDNRWATVILDVANYTNTNWWKRLIGRSGMENGYGRISTGQWRNTSAVTSMTVGHLSIATDAGSTFTLYGIKAA